MPFLSLGLRSIDLGVTSRAGMVLLVYLLQPRRVHMGVDLGGGDVGVAEQLLDLPEVGAAGQEMRGKAVSQRVRTDGVRTRRPAPHTS